MTIEGICVHVERRDKFPRQLIPPLSMPSKIQCDSSIPSMLALNWEDEETFLNKLFLHSQTLSRPLFDVPP